LPKQQGKMGIKCASRGKDKEWKEVESQSSGGFQMYTYSDRRTIGQGQKNPNEANKLLI